MSACIGTPVSWLRLETYARDHGDAAVRDHIAACPACRGCLDEIERDVVALPVLVVPQRRRRTWWPLLLVPAAAALLLVLLRPRPHDEATFAVKGVGEVTVGVLRERAGAISYDAREYLPGDRWKVIVTCPPSAGAWIDVEVGRDHPLPRAHLACGNRVVVPGAFTLDGGTNRICVHVSASEGGDGDQGCVTIRPE
ncbi:MAG: hypothetical protein JO257_35960 [Deltaproteobacteria bacterium]|nr:hypothetical protein [Deltaproteobacteria bacterium]